MEFELNEYDEAYLFDLCNSIWKQVSKKPSIRFTAFKVIVKTVKNYPELKHEFEYLCQDIYLDGLSSAALKSVLKMVKEI